MVQEATDTEGNGLTTWCLCGSSAPGKLSYERFGYNRSTCCTGNTCHTGSTWCYLLLLAALSRSGLLLAMLVKSRKTSVKVSSEKGQSVSGVRA